MFGRLTEFLAKLGTGHDLPLGPWTTTCHHHFVHLLTVTAMKRDLQISQSDSDLQYTRSRKRHCTKPSKTDSRSSPALEPADSSHDWTTRASSIYSWTINVAQSTNASSPKESHATQVNESMSGRQFPRRDHKVSVRTRLRSSSPTKKSTECRQKSLAFAHVFIEHIFEPPAHIHAHRCRIVGDHYGGASELEDIPDRYKMEVKAIAKEYLDRCRRLTTACKGEAEWQSLLFAGPIDRLVTLLGSGMLMTSASDKPWLAALKPCSPPLQELIASSAPRLMPSGSASSSFGSSLIPPGTTSTPATFNYNTPPPQAEPSESTVTTSTSVDEIDPSNPLTNPKPDISIGLDRSSFPELHQRLLAKLQDDGQLLSELHAVQLGLHFPFLLVETKGLTTSGNIIGAENQAAVGGACALRILDSLASLCSEVTELPPIIFTISTEGPIHELSIHYCIKGDYHMTVHRTWRTTLERDNLDLIFAIARIIYWGANSFRDTIIRKMNTNIETLYLI
jgi:hypothetical protein